MDNIDLMHKRLEWMGGNQQERMIKDKSRSFEAALEASYQSAQVQKVNDSTAYKALINPNKVNEDYDDKILSIGFSSGFKPGDVFTWKTNSLDTSLDKDSKWIIYLQDLTELSYFKGKIRKCNYEISWKLNNQIFTVDAAVIGPKETSLAQSVKSNIEIDMPNHSLSIFIPQNENTIAYFQRYNRFYLKGKQSDETCWRIEGIDVLSMPGIIQLHAVEYYSNKDTDDIEERIVDDKIVPPSPPEPQDSDIIGLRFIKPKREYEYTTQLTNGVWSIDSDGKTPIKLRVENNKAYVKWDATYVGSFTLCYNDKKAVITVESLF